MGGVNPFSEIIVQSGKAKQSFNLDSGMAPPRYLLSKQQYADLHQLWLLALIQHGRLNKAEAEMFSERIEDMAARHAALCDYASHPGGLSEQQEEVRFLIEQMVEDMVCAYPGLNGVFLSHDSRSPTLYVRFQDGYSNSWRKDGTYGVPVNPDVRKSLDSSPFWEDFIEQGSPVVALTNFGGCL